MPAHIFSYIKGLMQGERITATFLARQFGFSHDGITRMLRARFPWRTYLFSLIQRCFGVLDGGYLIIDDTVIAKPYGKAFAQAAFVYSSSLNRVVYGYHIVMLCWTNGVLTIPLSFRFYRKGGKSKVSLAQDLLSEAKRVWHLRPLAVLFDSWYGATRILNQIDTYGWTFVCQIKKNRVVNCAPIADDLTHDGDAMDGLLTGAFVAHLLRHGKKFFATNNRLQ